MEQEIQVKENMRETAHPEAVEQQVEFREENEKINQYKELDQVISRYSKEPGQLIRILQKAQDIFGCLSEEVQSYIAEKTENPVSEVNGVVTFYSLFSTEPKGEHTFNLCMGTACYVKGAQELMDTLKEQFKVDEGETTEDRLFTLKSTRCIGACGLAPVLVADGNVHGKTSAGEITKIIQKYRKGEKN
ncbi:MAG: NAD(P)H-dependent oxidoreductase subunit E [Desulfotomaculaceae bacterium]